MVFQNVKAQFRHSFTNQSEMYFSEKISPGLEETTIWGNFLTSGLKLELLVFQNGLEIDVGENNTLIFEPDLENPQIHSQGCSNNVTSTHVLVRGGTKV